MSVQHGYEYESALLYYVETSGQGSEASFFFYSSKGDQGAKLIDRSNAFQRLFAVLSVTHYSSMP